MSLSARKTHPLQATVLVLILVSCSVMAEDGARGPRQPDSSDGVTQLTPITTTVSAALTLPKDRPVAIDYSDSPKLTQLLQRSLVDAGFRVADADSRDSVSIRVRGVLELTGKHTARIRIAELAEKGTLIESADGPRSLAPADVAYVIAAGNWFGRLVDSGQLTRPAGAFLFLDVVGQATGAKDWFNKAVGGDRRGICLINCENWNKTRQAASHIVELHDGERRERVELRSELFAEDLQPGRVVSAGLTALVEALAGTPPSPPVLVGGEGAKRND
jgi:hypothetical protein